jgi:uncharacterized LabA/DUF88 family protein
MPTERLSIFIDAQNFYNGARRAFFIDQDSHVCGQFDPMGLGNLICSRPPPSAERSLQQVRIYTGRPDASKEPKTYAAHMKQCAAWESKGTIVIPRTLRYPTGWPQTKAQQKGVDVALAIDFVALAIDGEYDVGVIASTDTDLKPALEYVYRKRSTAQRVEVANWTGSTVQRRLSVPGTKIWCYWLNRGDYDSIADLTDYNL